MSGRGRLGLALAAAVVALAAAPAAAWAHASLLHTTPSASVTLNRAPAQVSLTYSEAVEPRFAVISVTDQQGHRITTGPPRRSPANPDVLQVPVRSAPKGWYLVYWRVISVDGHPVRGAFTYAVGPNPGPAPQFKIPSLRETAATPPLLAARWAAFLLVMAGVGLLIFRLTIARPLVARVAGVSLAPVERAAALCLGLALIVVPIYLDLATAEFALRSDFDLGGVIPLIGASAFGRGWLRLWEVLGLVAVTGWIAVRLDRPERPLRSVAALLALLGALAAIAALLLVPGLSGHAAQDHPVGLSLALDWSHLLAGSVWIGGLVGLTALALRTDKDERVRAMTVVVPRFSAVALGAVGLLVASGTWQAFLRLPTFGSLFSTGYGQALVAKIALLCCALVLAAVNLLRSKPRLEAARRRPGGGAAATRLLQRLVGGEVVLVAGAIFAAGLLSSLPPPSKALAGIGGAAAKVGPGTISRTVHRDGYDLQFDITPNKAAVPNQFSVRISKGGTPVRGAAVTARFDMLDMDMQQQEYRLDERAPATYSRSAPSLVMVGHWALTFTVTPPGGVTPFDVLLLDKANG